MKKHSPEAIARDLRARLYGEVLSDPGTRSLYATDASIYEIEPLCVVYPEDEEDVACAVAYAARRGLPIIARGGGSGLAGESLGRAIILDFTVHMNRLLELAPDSRTVTVEPGMILDHLNGLVAGHRLRFGPDPSSSATASVGGVLGNNSTGAHWGTYGYARDHVAQTRVVMADAEAFTCRPVVTDGEEFRCLGASSDGILARVHRELPRLLAENEQLIGQHQPKTTRNRAGYLLPGVLRDGVLDLNKLLVGSEGTLGIFTRATLKLVRQPPLTGLTLLYFASLEEMAAAVPVIMRASPDTCELMDRVLMDLALKAVPELAHFLPPEAGAMIYVEFSGESEEELHAGYARLDAALREAAVKPLRRLATSDPRERETAWRTRKVAVPLLFQRSDDLQPIPFLEDVAVPPEALRQYLERLTTVFVRHGLAYSAYAHAGDGELHIRPMMNLKRSRDVALLETIAGEIYPVVWELGGTISGEHGEGLVRAQWLSGQYGPLYEVFRRIKQLFDPAGILNPDKKITGDPHLMTKDLRFGESYRLTPGTPRLYWAPGEFARELERCNGDGACRTLGREVEMCPRYKAAPREHAAPRAKANLLRRLLNGRQHPARFSDRTVWEILDSCFNCKMCQFGCPSAVNIPKLVMEAKARFVAERGLPRALKVLSHAETFARLGAPLAPLVEFFGQSPVARLVGEKLVGIARQRSLPPCRKLRARPLPAHSTTKPRVILYPDLYARYYAPEIAQAALAVLEHHGFAVLLPDTPWCGMPLLEYGAVKAARKLIRRNLAALRPYLEDNVPLLVPEPTATLCLTQEWSWFEHTPEVMKIAACALDLMSFLARLSAEGRLRTDFQDLGGVNLGYHQPCHHRALQIGKPGMELVAALPGVSVHLMEQGCCGMAGTFGMRAIGYEESRRIGRALLQELKSERIDLGLTECSTCRLQMVEGSGKKTVHPIEVLAWAYGYPGRREPG